MIKLNYSLQFYRAPFFLPLVALLILLSAFASTYASPLSNFASDDQRFLALRDAASKEDVGRAAELAGQLSTYSLPAYVDYYVVKSHLRTASTTEITDFLARHANAAIADRLRNDWLLMLGHQRNWALFDAQYPLFVLNDDTQVKCYALLSKLQQGQNVADGARNLLTSSKVYGEGCFALFSDLVSSGQFSPTDMWNQLRWSAEANTTDITVQLAKLVDLDYAAKVLSKPNNKLEAEFTRPLPKSDEVRQTTLIALGRIARSDPDRAVNLLKKIDHGLNDSERSIAWSQIALASAQKLQPEAAEYWTRIGDASLSLDAYQWRVRTALRNLDWRRVKAAIESMPATLLNDSAWVYWLGRAYVADNKSDVAQPLFQGIADRPTFYGQLALEERGLQIVVPPTTPVQTLDLIALTKNSGLQDALHFYAMGLRLEGNREWNWQLRSMSEPQLLAAAEFARENDLLDRTVSTSDRTKTIFDYTQRFPTPHQDIMAQHANPLNLDMAWVYGLIRQESRFIQNAHSSAGANGLMQVMPGTARYVVKKMKWDNVDINRPNDIDTNIMLGTNYLNIILNNLNGSQVLATAGYNAGPGRAKAWRASLDKMVEGAVFAETIPFTETRDYVKNVMSNATYYAALFTGRPQSLKERLGAISPYSDMPIDQDLNQNGNTNPNLSLSTSLSTESPR